MHEPENRAIVQLMHLQRTAQKNSPAYEDYALAISALRERIERGNGLISVKDRLPEPPKEEQGDAET